MKKLLAATSLLGFSGMALAADATTDWALCIGIWNISLCLVF